MSLWPLLAVELSKLWRRRETLLLFTGFLLLPLLITFPMRHPNGSIFVRGQFDAFSLAAGLLGLTTTLLFPQFAIILVGASTMAREVDDGSLKVLLLRAPGRLQFYMAKYVGLVSFALGCIGAVSFGTFVGYLIFVHGGPYAAMPSTDSGLEFWAWQSLLHLLGLGVIGALVLFVGLKLGFGGSIGVGLGSLVTMKLLERWDSLRGFVPTFLSDAVHYFAPMATLNTSRGVLLLLVYVVVIVAGGMLTMRKMDLPK